MMACPECPPMNETDRNAQPSAWSPLGEPLFRMMWLATLVSNIGTWVHEVGAGWLMVTLDPHPLMVSLVQAATALPVFLLALPGGALADIIDRRRYLIVTQLWMMAVALLLALCTALGWMNGWALLGFTFALACGAALNTPAWAATLPELVPQAQLQPAIALNSLGINLARAVGPALAGVVVAAAGPQAAFLLNALSFLAVIFVLLRWRREARPGTLPSERFFGAMRAGMRYVREATALQSVMARAAGFFIFATATWALLPLVALGAGGGANTYGLLLAGIGAGAVGAAILMPRLRRRYSRDVLVRAATALYAAAAIGVALAGSLALLLPAVLATGAAWLAVLSTLHVSAQTAVPQWVRARALSLYLMVYAAGMTGGAVLWGAVAARWGVPLALVLAAAGGLLAMFATWRLSLGGEDGLSRIAPAILMRAQPHADDIAPERGPVEVHVEYRIESADAAAFIEAAQAMQRIRRRDGALSWGLFEDAAVPGRYIETFVVESWAEHLRQHHRGTAGDAEVVARLRSFHRGDAPPRVAHWIAVDAPGGESPEQLH
jgi:MFS family permease/quinol monooxygenase YgiN